MCYVVRPFDSGYSKDVNGYRELMLSMCYASVGWMACCEWIPNYVVLLLKLVS